MTLQLNKDTITVLHSIPANTGILVCTRFKTTHHTASPSQKARQVLHGTLLQGRPTCTTTSKAFTGKVIWPAQHSLITEKRK